MRKTEKLRDLSSHLSFPRVPSVPVGLSIIRANASPDLPKYTVRASRSRAASWERDVTQRCVGSQARSRPMTNVE